MLLWGQTYIVPPQNFLRQYFQIFSDRGQINYIFTEFGTVYFSKVSGTGFTGWNAVEMDEVERGSNGSNVFV